MNEDYKEWIEFGEYDLKSAEALMENSLYAHVVFHCQQALEKTLKAVIVFKTDKFPPKIHDCAKLAELAEIILEEEKENIYRSLTAYYFESRYPDMKGELTRRLDKQTAEKYMRFCEEETIWLQSSIRK
jgi:HEPN domain-containing protein